LTVLEVSLFSFGVLFYWRNESAEWHCCKRKWTSLFNKIWEKLHWREQWLDLSFCWFSDLKCGGKILLATRILIVLEIRELFRIWMNVRNAEKWSRSAAWKVVEQVNIAGKIVRWRMMRYVVVKGMNVDNAPKVSAASRNLNGKGMLSRPWYTLFVQPEFTVRILVNGET
jgi:hypothetical protein